MCVVRITAEALCVPGDAREPCGRGLGHPFGLLLCSKLVDLTEHELQFAAAFRFSKKFEDFWKIFPFPMKGVANGHLTERIFFSNDPPLALFGAHKKRNLPEDAPTRAWLKRGMRGVCVCGVCCV